MADYLVMAGFFLPLTVGLAAYVYTRRWYQRSRLLLGFDIIVIALALVLSLAFWWREITGHISQEIWLDEYGMLGVLIPMWVTAISASVLIVGALVRHFVFAKVINDPKRVL